VRRPFFAGILLLLRLVKPLRVPCASSSRVLGAKPGRYAMLTVLFRYSVALYAQYEKILSVTL